MIFFNFPLIVRSTTDKTPLLNGYSKNLLIKDEECDSSLKKLGKYCNTI